MPLTGTVENERNALSENETCTDSFTVVCRVMWVRTAMRCYARIEMGARTDSFSVGRIVCFILIRKKKKHFYDLERKISLVKIPAQLH